MRHCIACLALAGCSFSLAPITGGTDSDGGIIDAPSLDDSGIDAIIDAPPDAGPIDPLCFGAAPYVICVAQTPVGVVEPAPTTALTLTYATSTCNSGQIVTQANGGPELCVHDYTNISLNTFSKILATGTRPLVLVSTGDIRIDGSVEITGDQAAGGAFAGCSTMIDGGNDSGGGGGGAGGSFGTNGGNGGDVQNGGAGGNSAATATPTFLRGGCPGGAGGTSSSATGGAGGRGGGGLYLLAAGRLIINGKVTASGEGGSRGADGRSGGGGGGSGGMIVLYGGPGIMVAATAEVWRRRRRIGLRQPRQQWVPVARTADGRQRGGGWRERRDLGCRRWHGRAGRRQRAERGQVGRRWWRRCRLDRERHGRSDHARRVLAARELTAGALHWCGAPRSTRSSRARCMFVRTTRRRRSDRCERR